MAEFGREAREARVPSLSTSCELIYYARYIVLGWHRPNARSERVANAKAVGVVPLTVPLSLLGREIYVHISSLGALPASWVAELNQTPHGHKAMVSLERLD